MRLNSSIAKQVVVLNLFVTLTPYAVYGLFSKGASKMGYFFEVDENDISLCKLGNILILFNSEETKEAERAFKSKHDNLI